MENAEAFKGIEITVLDETIDLAEHLKDVSDEAGIILPASVLNKIGDRIKQLSHELIAAGTWGG